MLHLLSIASVALTLASPATGGDAPLEGRAAAASSSTPSTRLAAGEAAPLEVHRHAGPGPDADIASPLSSSPGPSEAARLGLPERGASPLDHPSGADYPELRVPLGEGPALPPAPRPDPRLLRLLRVDLMAGPIWRIEKVEAMVTADVEFGRAQGLSASLHASMIVAPDRDLIGVLDAPLGIGAVYRGRLRERAVYGSVGLDAGILIHRARTETGVLHRVDPDLRLPLKLAFTAGNVGFTAALVNGFSFRARTYERRGVTVWSRLPYRVGVVLGVHFDVKAGAARTRRGDRRRDRS